MRHEMSSVLLFDPRGIADQNITPVAPRKTKLEGLRLGVLDNSKWNTRTSSSEVHLLHSARTLNLPP